MAINFRTYSPVHMIAFAKHGVSYLTQPTGYIAMHGGQSVGQTTNFNITTINEIGQLESYEQVEGIPNTELTVTKVIDGYPLIQHLASQSPAGNSLGGRYNAARANVIAAIYNFSNNAASGVPLSIAFMSGMYVSAINFNIPVQGAATESVTLVGNNKVWYTGIASIPTGLLDFNSLYNTESRFNNADAPPGTGGVQFRENLDMSQCRWPRDLAGISTSGTNNWDANQQFMCHIQNVTVACNFGRDELLELGRRGPYYRYANFPTDVTCTIEVTTNEYGENRSAYEEQTNLTNEQILLVFNCGVSINLGSNNKLENYSTQGGDATGGNVTTTYSYKNQNSLTVTFPLHDFI